MYLSGTEKGTEAGNSVDAERQNTGNYCDQSSPIYFILINMVQSPPLVSMVAVDKIQESSAVLHSETDG